MLQVALIKSCCLASVFSFHCSVCGPKFPWKKIEMSFLLNARNSACMLNTSIKTKRPAKNSSVAHSTRCKMISKSWMSARTKSQSAPKIAIQPEREQETPSASPFTAGKHVHIHKNSEHRLADFHRFILADCSHSKKQNLYHMLHMQPLFFHIYLSIDRSIYRSIDIDLSIYRSIDIDRSIDR